MTKLVLLVVLEELSHATEDFRRPCRILEALRDDCF